jgi:hypothetical protein
VLIAKPLGQPLDQFPNVASWRETIKKDPATEGGVAWGEAVRRLWPTAVTQAFLGQPLDHALVTMRVESTLLLLVIEQLTGIGHLVLLSTMSWMVEGGNESEYSGWYGLNS